MADDTYDCVVIGQGLAGTTLAWQLLWRGARVLVIDREDEYSASRVAAGLMTPVTGQRLVPSWRLAEFWPAAALFYQRVEAETEAAFFSEPGQVRILASELERQRFQKRDPAEAADWVRDPAPPISPEAFRVEYGSFEIPRAARLDVASFLTSSRSHFQRLGIYLAGDVDSTGDTEIESGLVKLTRPNCRSKRVVFCQGFAGSKNGWFDQVQFDATRGEILTLRIPDLHETRIVNGGVWLVPLGDELFRAGATYDWNHLLAGPTAEGREEICERLRRFLRLPFEVVEHSAGVRPIVVGRHPVLGFHPNHPQIGIFNGLGSKGSLQAPRLAEQMADLVLDGVPLDKEVDVARRFPLKPVSISTPVPRPQRGKRLTERAHEIVRSVVQLGETAIDATAGNGHDTCFLAELVGSEGTVFAFDRQPAAIELTRQRLTESGLTNVTLCESDHSKLNAEIPERQHGTIAAVMFNLGYLPGGDKTVITQTRSTMIAFQAALAIVRPGGVVTVLAYPGHAGGDEETLAVEALFNSLDRSSFAVDVESVEGVESAPKLFVARRLGATSSRGA
jgi:glycine/D-amino acid oxidase-like deaminating enzyme